MVQKITLKNYRNIPNLEIDLKGNSGYLVAPNSSGKTNTIESIYLAVFGTSFKNLGSTKEIIGENGHFAKVEIQTPNSALRVVISDQNGKITKKHTLNDKQITISKIPSKFPIILFAPQSVDLVNGAPQIRRSDLDSFLSSCDPLYSQFLSKYNAILKNRNAMLRNLRENPYNNSSLSFWTDSLITNGEYIYQKRKEFFLELSERLSKIASDIYTSFESFESIYLPNKITGEIGSYREYMEAVFKQNERKEIIVGKTLYGIHKDDYMFKLNNQDLRYFGSRGQQRIAAFLFKVFQIQYMQQKGLNEVFLLLDDLFSELDPTHRDNIAEFLIGGSYQFLITSADLNEIPEKIREIKQIELVLG